MSSTWTERLRGSVDPSEAIVAVVRFGVLALCALLSLLAEAGVPRTSLLLLSAVAVLASVPLPVSALSRSRPLLEAVAASLVIVASTPLPEPLLPYLVVPPLAAGLLTGVVAAVSASGLSLAVLAFGRYLAADPPGRVELTLLAQWIGLGLATGLVGAWARSVSSRERQASSTYVTAHRLLTRLRDVARALPSGLDEVALAQSVLSAMRDSLEFDRGALYSRAEGGVLMPLAYSGADHVDWVPTTDEGIWGRVWASGRAVQEAGGFTVDDRGHRAVLALRLGDRPVGLIGIEREGGAWTARQLEAAQTMADDAALRIDTGQLFSEVRALATVEERRRLAREIHDGIAQEVASLGYIVDDLTARADDERTRADLRSVRDELTRIVSELRLSIFDLRSDVQPAAGLGAALTSYVRSVGTGSGLTVHLVLDESAFRLPIEAETELLRIAQEAITNARKHAHARNLWVTCRVDPPRAFLRVADDGRGLGAARADSYGMDIMRERSTRLGASFTVRNRVGGGTVVEVTLGSGSARPREAAPPAPALGRDLG